jgi:hypothetical protein
LSGDSIQSNRSNSGRKLAMTKFSRWLVPLGNGVGHANDEPSHKVGFVISANRPFALRVGNEFTDPSIKQPTPINRTLLDRRVAAASEKNSDFGEQLVGEFDDPSNKMAQAIDCWSGGRRGLIEQCEQSGECPVEAPLEEFLLPANVMVERSLGDAGGSSEMFHGRRVVSTFAKHAEGNVGKGVDVVANA